MKKTGTGNVVQSKRERKIKRRRKITYENNIILFARLITVLIAYIFAIKYN